MDTLNSSTTLNDITPEKLSIMKLKATNFDRDIFSEPASPTGGRHQSFAFGSHANHSQSALTRRTSRLVSGSSNRRASSFLQSHRSKMSMELTSQAEGKFFALMDLMSTASREASSLKESWARIISERDALLREKEELMIRVEEVTETLERQETEHRHHDHEHGERKRKFEALLLELSTALSVVTDHKKKIADRDHELQQLRHELEDLKTTLSRTHGDHDKTKTELEALHIKLKAVEEERDSAKHESHKHHGDLRNLLREHTELKSRLTDTSTKFESTRKEVLTLTDRIKIFELERDEHLHEKDRLQEELKRTKLRAEETSREFLEVNERHDRVQRDLTKLKDTLRTTETERDDHALTIENLRRDIKTKATGWEEADTRNAELNLKYEHIKREVVSVKEKLRDVELERSELRDTLDRSREDHRQLLLERDTLKEDAADERRKLSDAHRRITALEDTARRADTNIADLKAQIQALTDRNAALHRDTDAHRGKHSSLTAQLSTLTASLSSTQSELRSAAHARDRALSDLADWKHKYSELTTTITSYDDSAADFELEIESLRALLREAREQKERAISARHAADRERDEMVARYEEKCREVERWEGSGWGGGGGLLSGHHNHGHHASHGHGHGKFGTKVTRSVSTGTTLHHSEGKGEGMGLGRSQSQGGGVEFGGIGGEGGEGRGMFSSG
ncbi:hypothetical protein IQ07DRAFT_637261 [Pyrenochaeta sp. DS3sAY3a]|nr:hypothetical protein IQ07DRAFT_637261 [Pyrenochaeta sp. DS3sAY3a]